MFCFSFPAIGGQLVCAEQIPVTGMLTSIFGTYLVHESLQVSEADP